MSIDTSWQRILLFKGQVTDQYRAVVVVAWGCAVLFYGLGDTGLTIVVQELGGFETNPVARAFLRASGYAGLVVHKALILGVLGAIWRYYPTVGDFSPDPWRLVVPTLAAIRGAYLVGTHVQIINILM